MNLEQKLRQLKKAAAKSVREGELERQLAYLRRMEERPRTLPAQRVPHGIEEYVEGRVEANAQGEFFLARQALPFGRPYGKFRISDLAAADLSTLSLVLDDVPLPDPAKLVYLDTETTGLAGGTGTCAFLIGIGALEGSQFVLRQYFLRDYPEEKAVLAALAEALSRYEGIVTFNGKTFDLPLLETRYTLARMKAPFGGMIHLDLLHPARRLWKLRLASCELTNLERAILGIARDGDVPGSEIPQIYFDYLRTGNAQHLQPVFFHNALDMVTLAALAVEMARALREEEGSLASSLDLFSLSRILERAQVADRSAAACRRALTRGYRKRWKRGRCGNWRLSTSATASTLRRWNSGANSPSARSRWHFERWRNWPSTTSTARATLRPPSSSPPLRSTGSGLPPPPRINWNASESVWKGLSEKLRGRPYRRALKQQKVAEPPRTTLIAPAGRLFSRLRRQSGGLPNTQGNQHREPFAGESRGFRPCWRRY